MREVSLDRKVAESYNRIAILTTLLLGLYKFVSPKLRPKGGNKLYSWRVAGGCKRNKTLAPH